MTEQISEQIAQRREELDELRRERELEQSTAGGEQLTLALLDELESLERDIEVEKAAKNRAKEVREKIGKRLDERAKKSGLKVNRPEHAGAQGRPEHAGTQGPPPHASKPAEPVPAPSPTPTPEPTPAAAVEVAQDASDPVVVEGSSSTATGSESTNNTEGSAE